MAPTRKSFEIAVVGGGISGLTLAIALHARGVPTSIYEQAPQFAETGAGVSFRENAVQAMRLCHEGVERAFNKVRTGNLWPHKARVWFDYHDGFHDTNDTLAFTITTGLGQAGVHRARFLDELVPLFPKERAHFGKRVDDLEKRRDGRWRLKFVDGSTATADAVIGCDGIKSKIRQIMFGEHHPCAHPTFTHKYAYRALAAMDDAVKAVGEEKAKNSCMYMGPGGHVLTFPVNHGKILNVVAFHTTDKEWPDHSRLTKCATRDDALKDFEGYGHDVRSLLKLCEPNLEIWAIFHLGDHPLPYYSKGTLCLVGDAAHATSPHHGSGAGFCIEDCAILAELLADPRVTCRNDLEAVFATFNDVRKDRGNWLVQSSQHIGNCYEWMADGIGDDFSKIEHEIKTRNSIIADVNVSALCREAVAQLSRRISPRVKL